MTSHTNVLVHEIRYDLTDKLLSAEGTRNWAITSKLDHGKPQAYVCMGAFCPPQSRTPLVPGWRGTGDTPSLLMYNIT